MLPSKYWILEKIMISYSNPVSTSSISTYRQRNMRHLFCPVSELSPFQSYPSTSISVVPIRTFLCATFCCMFCPLACIKKSIQFPTPLNKSTNIFISNPSTTSHPTLPFCYHSYPPHLHPHRHHPHHLHEQPSTSS